MQIAVKQRQRWSFDDNIYRMEDCRRPQKKYKTKSTSVQNIREV